MIGGGWYWWSAFNPNEYRPRWAVVVLAIPIFAVTLYFMARKQFGR